MRESPVERLEFRGKRRPRRPNYAGISFGFCDEILFASSSNCPRIFATTRSSFASIARICGDFSSRRISPRSGAGTVAARVSTSPARSSANADRARAASGAARAFKRRTAASTPGISGTRGFCRSFFFFPDREAQHAFARDVFRDPERTSDLTPGIPATSHFVGRLHLRP